MLMKKLLLALVVTATGYTLNAQTLVRQVVASGGGYSSASSGSLSYTTGELVIETGTSGSFMLTQGFQQPDANPSTGIKTTQAVKVDYKLYPNPAREAITLSLKSPESITANCYIYDATGKLVERLEKDAVQVTDYSHSFNLSAYSAGNYFLKITGADNTVLQTISFSKQ